MTIANGQLVGPKVPIDSRGEGMLRLGGWRAEEQRWIDHDRRGVVVAPPFSPPGGACLNGAGDTGRGCTEVSYTGDYYPLAFGLPAVAIAATGGWKTALWLSRAASLAVVLFFIGLALAFSSRRPGWSMLRILGAVTPMVLFIGAALNPSGLEIAAALAFLSGLLELRNDPAGFSAWAWTGVVFAGVVTILAWQLGLFFAAAYLAVWLMLIGRAGMRGLFSCARSKVLCGGGVLTGAAALFVFYGLHYGVLHSSLSLSPFLGNLRAGRYEFTLALRGAVGIFGAYNVPLPSPMSQIWLLAAVVLSAFGMSIGSRRERIVLALSAAFGIAFPVVFYGYSYRYSGFGLQGRYVLPALVLIPVVAGHTLDRNLVAAGWLARHVLKLAVAGIAVFQLIAWWINAHHWAATSSLVLTHARWQPPLGWWPWLVAAASGAASLVASALVLPSARSFELAYGQGQPSTFATGPQPHG
jgi:hypothetical protein